WMDCTFPGVFVPGNGCTVVLAAKSLLKSLASVSGIMLRRATWLGIEELASASGEYYPKDSTLTTRVTCFLACRNSVVITIGFGVPFLDYRINRIRDPDNLFAKNPPDV